MIIVNPTYNPIVLIAAPKVSTDFLWNLVMLFLGLAILYFIFVFFFRNKMISKSKLEKNRKRELSPMISEFLFHEAKSTKEENSNYVNLKIEIRQLLKDDFNRKILAEILLDLQKDVSGETQKRVFKLYQDLGLDNDAFEKLKSVRWEIVSKAILNLTQMQVTNAYSFVIKFINDKRATIRKQAEIAVVTLKPEGINYFLDSTKYKISEWQQLKIIDVLRTKDDFLAPPFKAWLTSTNSHVVLFALRLIKYYNQNDAKPALIELVKHKNNQIKEEAISCIKEFHVVEAVDMLKLVFWKCSVDVKIAILDAIGFLGSDIDIKFLKLIEKKESNFSVKSKALSSINVIAPDSIMPSKGLLNPLNFKIPADLKEEPIEKLELQEEIEQTLAIDDQTKTEDKSDQFLITEALIVKSDSRKEEDESENENVSHSNQLRLKFLPIVILEDVVLPISEISKEVDAIEINLSQDDSTSKEDFNTTNGNLSLEVSAEELAFLPIVTDAIEETPENNNSAETSKEVDAIEINLSQDDSTSKEELNTTNSIPSLEVRDEELAFLPIVIDAIDETPENENSEETSKEVDAIEINLSKDDATSKEGLSTTNSNFSLEVHHEELAFLPIVTDAIDETPENDNSIVISDSEDCIDENEIINNDLELEAVEEKLEDEYSELQNSEIMNIAAVQDPILNLASDEPEAAINNESELYTYLFTAEEDKEEVKEIENEFNILEEGIEFFSTITPKEEETLENVIRDLIGFDEKEVAVSDSVQETDYNEEKATPRKIVIPKALLGDEFNEQIFSHQEGSEAERNQLLEDFIELGDERDLPFLNELLLDADFSNETISIQEIINILSYTTQKQTVEIYTKSSNVFKSLFETSDYEAKLILLDEIMTLGDVDEIMFLEELIKKEKGVIKQKATETLLEVLTRLSFEKEQYSEVSLKKKISSTSQTISVKKDTVSEYEAILEKLEISPSNDDHDMFDLMFELSDTNARETSSLLNQMYSFSTKILQKLNG